MGDCCWMSLVCRQEHRTTFEEIGFRLEEERNDGSVYMIDEQASYANDGDLRELAGKGIPFHAENGTGGEYGDGHYACDGRRVTHVDCLQGGGPVVEVGEDGVPDADQMHAVHDYYQVLAEAKKAIAADRPRGFNWKSANEILKGMDPGLFREQRRWLLAIIQAIRDGTLVDAGGLDWNSAVDALDGLENMLDDLADFATDVLGMNCLLEERPEEP